MDKYLNKVFQVQEPQSSWEEVKRNLNTWWFQEDMADIRIICQDRKIYGVRILLALAYPSLKEVLAGRDDEDGITLIMPDYTAREIEERVKLLIEGGFKV